MRVLLSTIGSRGEAQPVLAVAVALRELGHEAVVCAPPDFRAWAEELGVAYVPVGPVLEGTAKPGPRRIPTAEERQAMIDGTVAEQFRVVAPAAKGCDVVAGGGALAIAAHSAAEHQGVPYAYAAFAPITLPSPHHAPPAFAMLGDGARDAQPEALWAQDRERWNTMWRAPLDRRRAALGLAPVDDVRDHLFTSRPWLAADPVLAPWPGAPGLEVFQTGAWLPAGGGSPDAAVRAFLDAGEPPVYVGFGSVRAPEGVAEAAVSAARELGRRVVLGRGWAGLGLPEAADVLVIGDTDHRALFPRLAAVVHHGGAGTTTVAAAAGVPQVVVPQQFDQPYYADRVRSLGIGTTITGEPTAEALRDALATALSGPVAVEARSVAAEVVQDGALRAAEALLAL